MGSSLCRDFTDQSVYRISVNFPRIKTCLEALSETEIWHKPNNSSNSAGNLVLHLCGNLTQYIISGIGGADDNRNRDAEFSASAGYNRAELLKKIKNAVDEACIIINALEEDNLTDTYHIQGNSITGTAAIIHVTEHLSYHTGQLVYLTKMLKDIDTGFYKGLNLNAGNKN